jgi:hypothetical protein
MKGRNELMRAPGAAPKHFVFSRREIAAFIIRERRKTQSHRVLQIRNSGYITDPHQSGISHSRHLDDSFCPHS